LKDLLGILRNGKKTHLMNGVDLKDLMEINACLSLESKDLSTLRLEIDRCWMRDAFEESFELNFELRYWKSYEGALNGALVISESSFYV
jgi:hypothetical protein